MAVGAAVDVGVDVDGRARGWDDATRALSAAQVNVCWVRCCGDTYLSLW